MDPLVDDSSGVDRSSSKFFALADAVEVSLAIMSSSTLQQARDLQNNEPPSSQLPSQHSQSHQHYHHPHSHHITPHEKRRRSSASAAGGAAGCEIEEHSFTTIDTLQSFGVTSNDVAAILDSDEPASVVSPPSPHRRPSDPYYTASVTDANPQTPNAVVVVVATTRSGEILGASSSQLHRRTPIVVMSDSAQRDEALPSITSAPKGEVAEDRGVDVPTAASATPPIREPRTLSHSNDDEDGASCDDVDIRFPTMDGEHDATQMYLPKMGSHDMSSGQLFGEDARREKASQQRPRSSLDRAEDDNVVGNDGSVTATATRPTATPALSSAEKLKQTADFVQHQHQQQHSHSDGAAGEEQIVVPAVELLSFPGASADNEETFFVAFPPRRTTSTTSNHQQQPPSLWRNLHDHLLEPSFRHLHDSTQTSAASPTANDSTTPPLASRPLVSLHHQVHTHGLLYEVAGGGRSRTSSTSGDSFDDPPLAMSPRMYATSDDDDDASSRATSSVAYGLCGGSSHSSLFDTAPLSGGSPQIVTTTPPLSPAVLAAAPSVLTATVSPRTTRLMRVGGVGFGVPSSTGAARYGHIPHASTMFPSDSLGGPLEADDEETSQRSPPPQPAA